ncbi:MAG: alpha/beta fold hydrolase [Myxococcales bacterium]|nr:alpha/beta fold hydrolase [Myxococcales bacterium]
MSRLVRCGAVTWHVQELGDGPGLLLVHGAGSSADSFRALMPLLALRFRVVAVDLPGHARTRVSRAFTPDLPSIARALGELVAALKLAPHTVVGHSAGAAVIARMTLDGAIHPERIVGLAAALVPFDGAAGLLFPSAARLLGASRFAPRLLARAVSAGSTVDRIIEGTGSRLDEPSLAHYRSLASQPGHIAGVLSMLSRWDLAPLQRALPRLRTPVLLIAGERDLAVPLSQQGAVARVLPDARLVVVPGAGHLIHEEVPQRVAALVQKSDNPR